MNKKYSVLPALLLCAALSGCSGEKTSESLSSVVSENTSVSSEPAPDTESTADKLGEYCGKLSELWVDKWAQLSSEMEMITPKLSVFSAKLSDDVLFSAMVYPSYTTNAMVLYRSDSGMISEIGSANCGTVFEILKSGSENILHTVTIYPGSGWKTADDGSNVMVDNNAIVDTYYKIDGAKAEIALSVERDELDGEAASWSVAEGGENKQLTAEEYNAMRADYDKCEVVYSVDMDENGDHINDDFLRFEDEPDKLADFILGSFK